MRRQPFLTPRDQALSDLCDFIGLLVVMAMLVAPLFIR
jgi:hypothetical protein